MRANPLSAFVFVCGAMTLGLALYAWRQRSIAGAHAFALFMGSMAIYVFGYSFELASLDLPTMLLWNKVEYVGILAYAPLYLIFVLQYIGSGHWLTRLRAGLLFVLPALLLALKLGDDAWHLVYRTTQVDASGWLPLLSFVRGPAYTAAVAYNLLLLNVGLYLMWRKRRHASALYRSQTNLILSAALCLYLVYVLYLAGFQLPALRELDLNPFVFTVWGGAIGWAMFRHRLFDLAPLARDALIETLGDGVVVLDAQQRVVDANPAALKIFGWARAPVGQPAEQAFRGWDSLAALGPDGQSAGPGAAAAGEIRHEAAGQVLYYEVNLATLKDHTGQPVGRLVVLHDVTARKLAEEQLREISLVDEMTGLSNRRGFNVLAAQLMHMVARMRMAAVLIYADLDNLKRINDTLGHAAGDEALVATARILKRTFRGSDIVARFGGDEFVILALESADSPAEAPLVRLQAELDAYNARADRPYALSISFGVARSEPNQPASIEALMARADQSMYTRKAERKPA